MNIECTIKIQDKPVLFRFGMGAWEKFCELHGCEFHQMYTSGIIPIKADEAKGVPEVKWNIFVFKKLLFAAYFNGCQAQKRELDITQDDVTIWMDSFFNEDYQAIFEAVTNGLELVLGGKKKEVKKQKSK